MVALEQLPQYSSHKTVRAARIEEIIRSDPRQFGSPARLRLALPGSALEQGARDPASEFEVAGEWMAKHTPYIGGYFVVYAGGYQSFSPAEAFEEGYTRL